jgi:hypothetical protein
MFELRCSELNCVAVKCITEAGDTRFSLRIVSVAKISSGSNANGSLGRGFNSPIRHALWNRFGDCLHSGSARALHPAVQKSAFAMPTISKKLQP